MPTPKETAQEHASRLADAFIAEINFELKEHVIRTLFRERVGLDLSKGSMNTIALQCKVVLLETFADHLVKSLEELRLGIVVGSGATPSPVTVITSTTKPAGSAVKAGSARTPESALKTASVTTVTTTRSVTTSSPTTKATSTTTPSSATKSKSATTPGSATKSGSENVAKKVIIPPTQTTVTSPEVHTVVIKGNTKQGDIDPEVWLSEHPSQTPVSNPFVSIPGTAPTSVVIYLIQKGADITERDENGLTMLHRAARSGNSEMIIILLEHKVNINLTDRKGRLPLDWAVMSGQDQLIKLLLSDVAVLNTCRDGFTPLQHAVLLEHKSTVQVLLDLGSNLEVKDKDGITALQRAIVSGNTDIVDILLRRGADWQTNWSYSRSGRRSWRDGKESFGMASSLHHAADYGWIDIVKLLVACGANVHDKDQWGYSVYVSAVLSAETVWVYSYLLEKFIDPRSDVAIEGIARVASSGNAEAASRVFEMARMGVPVNSYWEGATPLYYAACHNAVDVIHQLRNPGADFEAKVKSECRVGETGETPLMGAARNNCVEAVATLLKYNVDVNARTPAGFFALQYAARCVNEVMIKLLLENGADVKLSDMNGETVLHDAAVHGSELGAPGAIRLLIEHGGDIKAKARNGRIPLQYIPHPESAPEVVKLLTPRS